MQYLLSSGVMILNYSIRDNNLKVEFGSECHLNIRQQFLNSESETGD